MIILVRADASAAQVDALGRRIRDLGLTVVVLDDAKGRALEVLGDERGRVLSLADDPAVEEVLTRRTPLAGGEPLWPHAALRVGMLAVALLSVLLLLAAFFPPALSDPARPPLAKSPAPEWYARPPAAVLEAFPSSIRWIGGALVLLFGAALLLLPYLDRFDPETPKGRAVGRLVRAAGAVVLLACAVLAMGFGS